MAVRVMRRLADLEKRRKVGPAHIAIVADDDFAAREARAAKFDYRLCLDDIAPLPEAEGGQQDDSQAAS